MSERPAPVTRTDEILLHLVDQVQALGDLLRDRGGAVPETEAPADDTSEEPADVQPAKKAPAKKASTKKPVDGR